eukprot:CCRYP_020464-RD/>CCRYP_020464-RD protein AED:0.48 eAED:1.00 QI:0/0/0/1/0/0/2/0/74
MADCHAESPEKSPPSPWGSRFDIFPELELAGRESLGLEGRGRRRRMGGGGGMAAGVGGWVEVLFGLEGRRGGKC